MVEKLEETVSLENDAQDLEKKLNTGMTVDNYSDYWHFCIRAPGFMQPERKVDEPKPEDKYFNFKIKKLKVSPKLQPFVYPISVGIGAGIGTAIVRNLTYPTPSGNVGGAIGGSIGMQIMENVKNKPGALKSGLYTYVAGAVAVATYATINAVCDKYR